MSRTVTGTLLLPNGQPMANARIFFTAKRTEAVSIVEGVNAFFDTDNDGDYSQVIVDGWYSVSIEWQADAAGSTVRRRQLGNAVVEAGASTTLEALIIASNPAASVETTLLYEVLEQAQQARDDAEASADAAAASAASVTPTTGPDDTTPGHLWRTDDLVKTASQQDGTLGRMLKVGDVGVANISLSLTSPNLNSNRINGFYYANSPTNGPGGNGWLIHQGISSTFFTTDYTRVSNGDKWHQSTLNGTPNGWRRIFDTGNTSSDVQVLLNAINKSAIGSAVSDEGGFTPSVRGGTSAGAANYTTQLGRYRRIGNRVEFQLNLSWTGHTGTGQLQVINIPFTASATSGRWSALSVYFNGMPFIADSQVSAVITSGASYIQMLQSINTTGSASSVPVPASCINLVISGTYEV